MSPWRCSLPAWMVLDGYGRADGRSDRCRSCGDQEDGWQPSRAQVCRSVMALAFSPRLQCRSGTAAWQGRCVCQKWRIARLYTFVCLFVLGTLPPGRNATLAWRLASASRARSDMLISIYSACLLHRAPALDTEHARSVAAHALLCATSHMPLYDHWETC